MTDSTDIWVLPKRHSDLFRDPQDVPHAKYTSGLV